MVPKTAYFNCVGGASGDMVLGALVDVGVSLEDLKEALAKLSVEGYTLSAEPGQRTGVNGTMVSVRLDETGCRPRRWQELVGIVERSSLSPVVVERATAVLRRLVEAEAAVHRVTLDEAHLDELGTLDTLVDVVGSVVGIEMLGVEQVYSSPFPSGSGMVESKHGLLPVPAPATTELFAMSNAPVVPPPGNAPDAGEMVTPTGAAIITTLAKFQQPVLNLHRVGYGLGSRDSRHYPNVLALWLGEEVGVARVTDLSVIETNIDDTSAEVLGYVRDRLFELGARDVWFTSIQMKKNRPGTMLSAIVPDSLESRAVTLVLRETSTLGVRVRPCTRYEASREVIEVETSVGRVQVKVKRLEDDIVGVAPEYESCVRVAREKDMPLQEVMRLVQREATERLRAG